MILFQKAIHWLIVHLQLLGDIISRTIFGIPLISTLHVTPHVSVGGSFNHRGLLHLKKKGVTAIVNMRKSTPIESGEIPTLHLPTTDWTPVSVEDFIKGVAFIATHVKKDGHVYVHCKQGVGRGPSMVAAYLISIGYTVDEALDHIKDVRGFIRPNAKQRTQLHHFATYWAEHHPQKTNEHS